MLACAQLQSVSSLPVPCSLLDSTGLVNRLLVHRASKPATPLPTASLFLGIPVSFIHLCSASIIRDLQVNVKLIWTASSGFSEVLLS